MPTETKVWKAIGSGSGASNAKDTTTTINIDSLQLKIVNVGNDDDNNDSSSDSDDELGELIYNSSNTAKRCREEAIKDTVSIATSQVAEVGGEKRTYDVSTSKPDTVTMTSNVMDNRLSDNTSSIATNKLQYYTNNNNDFDSTNIVQKKKKQRYANEEIVKRLLAERELKRMSDMKNSKQMRGDSTEKVVVVDSMDMKSSSRGSHVANGDNKEGTNKNVHEKKKDTPAADQSSPLVVGQTEQEKSSISEYVTAMNSIESMLSNQIKKEKERRVGKASQEQSKKEVTSEEDVKKSESEAFSEALPSAPPRDFDWVSHYRQHKNASKVSLPTTDKAKKKAAKEPLVIVTKRNYQQMGYHNYQIKDVKVLKQISTVVIPQPRPTRPQPQVNGRDWQSHQHLLRHHTPTHRQRTPYSQRYHPPTLHKASPPPYRQKTMSSSQSTRVHKKSPHASKYKVKRPPGRPKHGVSERKMLRGPPPVVHDGSPDWRSKIDSRQDDVVDTRDDVEEDSRAALSRLLVLKQRQKESRDIKKARHGGGALARAKADVMAKQQRKREVDSENDELKQTLKMDREAKAKVWNRRIDLERQIEDERYSMEAERLVKRAKHCEEGNNEEQVRRVKELLEMTDDLNHLGKERERAEEEQIRYVQMLAVRELQRRQVIESRMNWI